MDSSPLGSAVGAVPVDTAIGGAYDAEMYAAASDVVVPSGRGRHLLPVAVTLLWVGYLVAHG